MAFVPSMIFGAPRARSQSPNWRRVTRHLTIISLLCIHTALLAWQSRADSATWDEPGHFAAGLEHWSFGDFRLYSVNPPLVRLVALAPIAFEHPEINTLAYPASREPGKRPEFLIGPAVAAAIGPSYFHVLTIARWSCIPFSILGAIVCLKWATELFGDASGLTALGLWTFSPTVLAYGHLITPDIGAAAVGLWAVFEFRRWLIRPRVLTAVLMGIAVGLAELTKSTWLILFAIIPIHWLIVRASGAAGWKGRHRLLEAGQVIAALLISVCIINLGYGFQDTLVPLRKYDFVSRALSGKSLPEDGSGGFAGNRFRDSWLGAIPVPLPADYVLGIDQQKTDFERGQWSFLRGAWRLGGWWYYYLYAMLIKEPLGTWALGLLAIGGAILTREYRAPLREELLLIVPAVAIIALVSSQTGFNHHVRYVLPAFPFIFILISRVGQCFELHHRAFGAVVCVALAYSFVSSLSVFPHSLSYFNELAGGPKHGHWHLANSNADWGQDLLYLAAWYKTHPDARPLHLGYDLPLIDPRQAGVDWQPIPVGPTSTEAADRWSPTHLGPLPGWYAISVNQLHDRTHRFDYFSELKPVDWVGYTMPVYHITLADANRLRRKYGMPELPVTATTEPADDFGR